MFHTAVSVEEGGRVVQEISSSRALGMLYVGGNISYHILSNPLRHLHRIAAPGQVNLSYCSKDLKMQTVLPYSLLLAPYLQAVSCHELTAVNGELGQGLTRDFQEDSQTGGNPAFLDFDLNEPASAESPELQSTTESSSLLPVFSGQLRGTLDRHLPAVNPGQTTSKDLEEESRASKRPRLTNIKPDHGGDATKPAG
ncbi:hypothetical protein PGT21_031257 [Puccinia graminis f. sp. tritici]|uniref:Uncharacterized protein n=1 Tax=Puccinia graminis f. sp. tritici TaxID=56615 RepID=A0A5B0PF15_PUCGR|nr:hypothetical protein PGT21_031257 [Puccinia graminis f. sp. tritici]KAA1120644.1 hypothetical protein PGTUg99_016302 [Puccinia graminis f. sp. tritici]